MSSDEEKFLKQQARQGNAQAITSLLNSYFAPQKINVKAEVRGRGLRVRLESRQAPTGMKVLDQALYDKLVEVKPYGVKRVLIQSWQSGSMKVSWSQDFEISEEGVKPVGKRNYLSEFRQGFNSLDAQSQATAILLPFGLMFLLLYCSATANSCESLKAEVDRQERLYDHLLKHSSNGNQLFIADVDRKKALDKYNQKCK